VGVKWQGDVIVKLVVAKMCPFKVDPSGKNRRKSSLSIGLVWYGIKFNECAKHLHFKFFFALEVQMFVGFLISLYKIYYFRGFFICYKNDQKVYFYKKYLIIVKLMVAKICPFKVDPSGQNRRKSSL